MLVVTRSVAVTGVLQLHNLKGHFNQATVLNKSLTMVLFLNRVSQEKMVLQVPEAHQDQR